MKALELTEALRAAFAADSAFAGVACHNDLTADTIARPALVFAMQTKAINDAGTALTFALTIWVETAAEKRASTDPDPGLVHRELTELVREKLHGTGKAALLAALNLAAAFDWRGWSATESDPGIETHHFRTPIPAAGVVVVL